MYLASSSSMSSCSSKCASAAGTKGVSGEASCSSIAGRRARISGSSMRGGFGELFFKLNFKSYEPMSPAIVLVMNLRAGGVCCIVRKNVFRSGVSHSWSDWNQGVSCREEKR